MRNCLIWAVAMYLRRARRAKLRKKQTLLTGRPDSRPPIQPYITLRKSREAFYPHFLYGEWRQGRHRLVSYVPLDTNDDSVPWPWFVGRVMWGDAPKE